MARGRFRRRGGKAKTETAEVKADQEVVETQNKDVVSADPEAAAELVEQSKVAVAEGTVVQESDGQDKGLEANVKDDKQKGGNGKKNGQQKAGKGRKEKDTGKGQDVEIAGLIFMCNTSTKKDCFKYRVFGLPEAKKHIVERVKKGIKLFLFDFDQRVLYGIYKAMSAGGMNLEAEAFKDSERKFPAQVRFRIHKDCLPIEESVFKQAIKENYFGRNKFKCELNSEQVLKLMQLFRPLDSRGLPQPKPGKDTKREQPGSKSRAPRGAPPARRPPRAAPPLYSRETVYPREYAPMYPREPRNGVAVPQDLYQPSIMPSQILPNPEIELLEAEALYRQRLQMRQMQEARMDALDRRGYGLDPLMDASLRQAGISSELTRKRLLDDPYADERAYVVPKRPVLQDSLYRDLEYQREMPVSGYADGLHTLSAALPHESLSSQLSWRYP